ncbi:hypothetical protein BCR43DRAFT_176978 [Syncephalastrum racemosum]|uniref:Uncharacterized protein n=1 Tax=Syncephalastrum racemosum TaxID=13706 RepID=A0A1X2HPU9_SYNRA|nr:hypothetical protein BCR43DRAFT_176978 [Syncephalastrum racemosum]
MLWLLPDLSRKFPVVTDNVLENEPDLVYSFVYACAIKISKGKRTHSFDPMLALEITPQNTPKITKAHMEELSDIYTLRLLSGRENLDTTSIKRLDDNREEQGRLASLQKYPRCLKVLQSALSCRDHYAFESFAFPALDPNTTTKELNFYRFIKHALYDYASKCFRSNFTINIHERTFFSTYIVPIFCHSRRYTAHVWRYPQEYRSIDFHHISQGLQVS